MRPKSGLKSPMLLLNFLSPVPHCDGTLAVKDTLERQAEKQLARTIPRLLHLTLTKFNDQTNLGHTIGTRSCPLYKTHSQYEQFVATGTTENNIPYSQAILLFLIQFCVPFKIVSAHMTGQSVGGQTWENSEKNHLAHPQAELGMSHVCPVWCSNQNRHSREMIYD